MNTSDPSVVNHFPVIMTEFGHGQDTADYATVYSTCLRSYLGGLNGGWMMWVLAGSYYIREGTQDYDETWGLFSGFLCFVRDRLTRDRAVDARLE
jgi:hypothetical protein